MWKSVGITLNIFVSFQLVNSEIFTAQFELESLFELRKSVHDGILLYLRKEEMRLQEVKNRLMTSSGLSRIDCSSSSTKGQHDTSLLNPLNAFLAIKALSMDLTEILSPAFDTSNTKEFKDFMEKLNKERKFPGDEDVTGAATALLRLQETYLMKPDDISKGCLVDGYCSTPLTADDCFEIGKQSYKKRDYDNSIAWMTAALAKLEDRERLKSFNHSQSIQLNEGRSKRNIRNGDDGLNHGSVLLPHNVSKREVLNYLTWAEEIQRSLNFGKQLLTDITGLELDHFLEEVVKVVEVQNGDEAPESYITTEKNYKALCRGEFRELSSTNGNLKCLYSSITHPFYIIGPVKQEVVSIDPPIWILHDVLYDQEIEIIKKLAIPHFKTATVVSSSGPENSPSRVSKSAWLVDSDDPTISKVNKRVEWLTNLDLETAEDLQIANYGLGGMYLPHLDFGHTNESEIYISHGDGNRIATLMFYMSNVEAGGATVFPLLKLSIWPKKGSALFWYNLKPDGRGDFKTKHAACPVLLGSKWVANKWIHERGQEFRRPCDLHPSGNIR